MEYSFKSILTSHVPASGLWRRAMAVVIALTATVATWARVGDTFTTGGLMYKVTSETPNREVEVYVYDEDEIPADLIIPGVILIPDETEGVAYAYSVTSISDNALSGCSKLTSVIIPYNLTSIGKGAFKDCTGLTEVELPEYLETIGQNAFRGCSGLRKLEFGGNLKEIERDAFKGCVNVEEILCFAYNFVWTDYGCDDFKPDGTTLCFVRNYLRKAYEDRWRNGDAADKVNVSFVDYYELMIAGTRVTAKNKNDILGDGAAVYDSETKTLTLNKDITVSQTGVYGIRTREDLTINVNSSIEIDCALNNPIWNYCSNMTIKGQGALTLKCGGGEAIRVNGGGSLTIDKAIINTSGTEYGIYVTDGNLTIKGSSINISSTEKAIWCEKTDAIVLSDCHLINPSGAQLSGSDILDANGNACKALTIIPNNAVGTPIDEAHFPDAIFRNWILAQDYGILGYLPTTVSNVNYIDVKDQGIADLTGIEYFTNLQELYCSNNKLTKLDVSQNTKLEVLHCEGNQISGTNMDALIASLPSLGGTLCAYSTKATEGNEINSLQVADAKAKNWQVRMVDGTNYTDYAGIPAITIDATNFPDDNFRKWILDQDYGKDGVLTEKETAAIKMINVRNKNIIDLKGIEHFTALTSLDCNSNELTTLDMSKNTELKILDCQRNKLITLDLSKNTALTTLGCGTNQLTTLDVSKNTALTTLGCGTNQLTSLDLSKNTALTSLKCYNNQLTTLDVSNNTALTSLDCSDNQLTTLDVSKNTKLVNLYCYRNQIRGKGMEALVESLPTVNESTLYILREDLADDNNEITTTHVTTAKAKGWKVMKYNLETKQFEDYAGIFAVHINATNFPDANFRAFVSDPSIDLDESGYLTEAEIAAVTEMSAAMKDISNLKGIEHFTALTSLDCLGNKLTSLDLSKNTALTKLICVGNQLSELDVTKNTALTYLDCDGNKLTALDLSKNTALEQLYCDENQLTTLNVTQNKKLTLLSCYSNKIYGDGMQTLVGSLHSQGGSPKLQVYTNDAADVNKMTKAQVAATEAKGWTILMWDGSGWAVYNGITPGDANGDGVVNVADIVAITRSIKGLPVTGFSIPAADMNNNGNADKDDIPLVQKIIMKK